MVATPMNARSAQVSRTCLSCGCPSAASGGVRRRPFSDGVDRCLGCCADRPLSRHERGGGCDAVRFHAQSVSSPGGDRRRRRGGCGVPAERVSRRPAGRLGALKATAPCPSAVENGGAPVVVLPLASLPDERGDREAPRRKPPALVPTPVVVASYSVWSPTRRPKMLAAKPVKSIRTGQGLGTVSRISRRGWGVGVRLAVWAVGI